MLAYGSVIDPALFGEPKEHVRIEMLVSADDLENVTYTDLGDVFTVIHRGPLMSIFSDDPEWNQEEPEMCAMRYNSHFTMASKEPVIPVTVSPSGDMWEVYYMTVRKAARILKNSRDYSGYEILPHPLWAMEKLSCWYIQHRKRMCTQCVFEALTGTDFDGSVISEETLKGIPSECTVIQVSSSGKRLTTLCDQHLHSINKLNTLARRNFTL